MFYNLENDISPIGRTPPRKADSSNNGAGIGVIAVIPMKKNF